MTRRTLTLSAAIVSLCAVLATWATAVAQQAQEKVPATSPGDAATTATSPSNDEAQKKEILASPEWRRAMFEFSEWLSAQPFYNKQQVDEIKARFNRRVAGMTAQELAYMLADMEAKFKVINTPEAREARAWMAQYLAVLSDKKRAEVLKDAPNLATMTAAQLSQEIQRIEQKRQTLEQEQSAFRQSQSSQIQAVQAQERAAQQQYTRAMSQTASANTFSPYRSPTQVNARLNNARLGTGMSYYVGPWGGLGISFSPSSW